MRHSANVTTLSVVIRRDPHAVYAFVSNGKNLPRWATTFCRSVKPSPRGWLVDTPQGPVTIRLAEQNTFGVVDHDVIPPSGDTVSVPMRVVPHGDGSAVLFTLFRRPGMSARQYADDLAMVTQDLRTLKRVMEARGSRSRRRV